MSRPIAGLSILAALALSGCNKAPSAVPTEAQQTADALTGDAAGDASTNAACKNFTVAAGFPQDHRARPSLFTGGTGAAPDAHRAGYSGPGMGGKQFEVMRLTEKSC